MTATMQPSESWASEFYRTRTPDEAYGHGWQDWLAKAEPVACPPWCEVEHGVLGDLFRNLVTEDDCALHELDLAKVGDFAVGLVKRQYHSVSGKENKTHLWLTHSGGTFGIFARADLAQLASVPGVEPDLVTVVRQAATRLEDLNLGGEVDQHSEFGGVGS